ncbi:TPA: Lipase-like pad4 [Trebouxia sp. C0004]
MLAGSTLSTAVVALILGGVGIIFTVFNLYVTARNRRLDEEDKQDQRAAEQSYKYSKEVQNILFEVERYKRQKCQDSDLVYYTRLKELQHEEDWDIKQKLTVVNGFWRETIFLWNKRKLPAEFFEKQNIWLYRGNMYRLLVEPCDIANHYGLKSMSGVGHYLAGNRPGRYEFLEELWLRRKGEQPLSSIQFALMEQKLDPHGRKKQSSKTLLPQVQALCAGAVEASVNPVGFRYSY